jgi:hypothetical protein
MAVPSYTEDLTDITLAESVTGWSALGGGTSGLGIGNDFRMQGTNCVDKQVSDAEKGQVYNFGSTITPGTNTHFFVWVFLATPGLTNTLANRGLGIVLGTSTTAYNKFHVEGSETYGATGRVGKCYPIRYVTTSNASAPYRTLTGSPGANPQYFGATANITGTVKSVNLGVDAIRHGTGMYITAGEIASPATFAGAASANDAISARWGIFTALGGPVYELQGRFVMGQNNAGTATQCHFDDSNKIILLVDTPHSLTDFTQLIADHASTVVNWTNVTVEAIGTNNPGRLVFNNSSTDGNLTSCSFSKIGISTLNANVTATGCTWRQTGAITLQGATLTNCVINANSAASAVIAASPAGAALVTGSTFTSGGTGHGLEITGTAADMTLTNNTWSGYAAGNGSTGNEAVYVNIATGSMNLTITGGTVPSVRTAGATVTVIAGLVSASVKVTTIAGTAIENANVLLAADTGGPFPYNVTVTITNSGTTATVTHTSHGLATNDKVLIKGASHYQNNGVFSITNTGTNTYTYTLPSAPGSNPTGTIKSTFVVLSGLTNVTGDITMSRVFASAQPVTGWARKSSGSPYYKTSNISGSVSSTLGFSTTVQLIPDE